MRFAVIADAHTGLYSGDEMLARAIEEINRLELDFVVFLGDLVDPSHGGNLPGLYQRFGALCGRIRHQVRYVPGNHDLDHSAPAPAAYYQTFTGSPAYYAFSVGATRFIALDTNEGGTGPAGGLSSAQLAWLAAELSGPGEETPAIILTHHPPFPADPYRLVDFPAFFAAIAGSRNQPGPAGRVRAIISGHRHFRETHMVDGIRFEVAGPLSFGLCGMREAGFTLVEGAADDLRFTWRALGPSPPAPGS